MVNLEIIVKGSREPLGFSLLRDVILRLSQNVENHYEYRYLEHPEKAVKKPYKTWGILALFDTISQNARRNDQKTIGIFTIGYMEIHRAGKPYKTCRNI